MRRLLTLFLGEWLQSDVWMWQAGMVLGAYDTGTVLGKETGGRPGACQHLSDKTDEFGGLLEESGE